MNRKKYIYIILPLAFLVLCFNISELDFDALEKGPFSGIVSNIFVMLAMLISLRNLNKNNIKNVK
jgi:hypothetical protein